MLIDLECRRRSSVVIAAALVEPGANGAWAEQILEQDGLYAPEHPRVEAASVLRRLEREKKITQQEANAAFEDLVELNVELYEFEVFADRTWELRHNVSIHDGWYVALAEALNLPLATLDGRLARADGTKCRFLTPDSKPIDV